MEFAYVFYATAVALWVVSDVLYNAFAEATRAYREQRPSPMAIAGEIWTPLWLLFSGLVAAAIIVLILVDRPPLFPVVGPMYVSIWALLIFNVVLAHMWRGLMHRRLWPKVAIPVAVLLVLSAIAVVVLLGLFSYWISFGLYMPYVLFTGFVLAWNILWLWKGKPAEKMQ